MQAPLKCKRNGCKKAYEENNPTACHYHPGKPIFHDLKKGWTCCNVIVYDWDDFQNIKPCANGPHTDVQEEGGEFYKSTTVDNAQKGLDKFNQNGVPVKNINDFNKEQELKKQQAELEEAKIQKQPFITPSGKFKCQNKGCMKEYDPKDPQQADEHACRFHPGEPIFHDLKKFWSCCKAEKYDWDEFMKIPTCKAGKHVPKLV